MIDMIEIAIQFDSSFVETVDERHALVNVDFKEMNIPLGARSIHFRDDDTIGTSGLYHPWESLPTNFTGLAAKVHFDGYFFPYVTIKGSPAKILQGHNVFGTDDLLICATEMLYWLDNAYPELYSLLAVNTAEIRRLDVTYHSYVGSPKLVRSAIDYMSRISNGQTKPTKSKKYETTVYWGGKDSRLIKQKCYSKFDEYMAQLDAYEKLAKKGDKHAAAVVAAMSDKRVMYIAKNSLRWEVTFMKRWLERRDLPTNLWDFINYQKANPYILKELWNKGFEKIFDAMKGQDMTILNDDKALEKLKAEFVNVTPKGKLSYRKSYNLFGFYMQLKAIGLSEMKAQKLYSPSQFNRLIADLVSVGFTKAYLQNCHVKDDSNVVPFIKMIEIDFAKQVPDWYVEPIPTPLRLIA